MASWFNSTPDELFEMFSEQFPNLAEKVVEWHSSDDFEIRLNMGDYYMYYDEVYHTIRYPFKLNDRTYEEAWRKMFAFKLERRMFSMGYTQYDLAEKSGLSYVTISKYLNGKASPSGHTLAKLAQVLECSLDAFDEALVEY